MEQKTILLIEDESDVLLSNKEFLELRGYGVLTAKTLASAEGVLKNHAPDLILLDINLPDGSGLDFITRLRESELCNTPVIFLTCRTDSADIIEGLTRGGRDYMTKPYDFGVLAARVEAQLRAAEMPEVVKRGPLTLHVFSQQAYLAGENMQLAKKEFALLLLFVRHEGKTLAKEYIYEKAWGQPLLEDDSALYMQVSRLKKKLEQNEAFELYASRNEGYCLNILG